MHYNPETLSYLRRDAELIFSAGTEAVKGDQAIRQHVRTDASGLHIDELVFDINRFENIWITGAGKASAAMADAIEKQLGDKIKGGVISVKYGHGLKLEKIRTIEAGHPVFDQNSVTAAEEIMSVARSANAEDMVIFLLSGGGSALMANPVPPLTMDEKQDAIKTLLLSGADIDSINTIRKHISAIKGGQLAAAAYPANLITLIISDVVGDKLDAIGSGPTVPDTSTYGDCLQIVEKYNLSGKLPAKIMARLTDGAAGKLPETPRANDPVFATSHARVIADNGLALAAARKRAASLGYNTVILSSSIEGDTGAAAKMLSSIAIEVKKSGNPVPAPACILSGGETTVAVTGDGQGGRNQEFALASAFEIAGRGNIVVLCGGTDGTDGPTDAAGGITDSTTILNAREKGICAETFLNNNDSYNFLNRTGELLVTGPTNTNVMDLRIFLVA